MTKIKLLSLCSLMVGMVFTTISCEILNPTSGEQEKINKSRVKNILNSM